jgi:mRNA interferase RelE/StbE
MKVVLNERALDSLEDAPPIVRKAFLKQIKFLEKNLHRPSLRAKKYDEAKDIWQARVSRDWRFYFRIVDDCYRIEELVAHPK